MSESNQHGAFLFHSMNFLLALFVLSTSAETNTACDLTVQLPVQGNVQTAPTPSNYSVISTDIPTEYLDLVAKDRTGWNIPARVYEYVSVSNPVLKPVPILSLGSEDYAENKTHISRADFSALLDVDYPATSPNLLAAFVKIMKGESQDTTAVATSQAFYVVQGSGYTKSQYATTHWGEGDMLVIPNHKDTMTHFADETAILYWVHDEPLLRYLGVTPTEKRFEPTHYTRKMLLDSVETIKQDPDAAHKNRMGILLGNRDTEQTKTLSHTLWALMNTIPPKTVQKPHKHNSVALDLCISAGENTYTLMSRQIDDEGNLVNPVRMDWEAGSMFVTPPGWWHSHVNEGTEAGWVLPLQDAGLYTYQRSLDIRFAPETVAQFKQKLIAGVMDQF
mmetsp:Transcript_25583/g.61641  ORF Transcript_25583/g.61641 Transcript_25583/m.61641 type:complete len:391 (+) Transcript_25583:222-1394(+)|eukprot:CAMPEP_0114518192 /NCGR_PEP_ID=MMETSP0109-20121206/18308_1 /TAXON_ID=29199 /ORGANISM="Chlorarachnion reptans, Strain CCCM449" /LENGTH=390 /DNA_ID=CAMNT_0001698787 /DNA_START=164 /DNA_END=1336 /DNA_ORIENTATION=+